MSRAGDTQPDDPELRLQHALDLAYRYLSRRDRTAAEVRRHLESKRVEPMTVLEAIADLERAGYVDDERYARQFTEDRRALDDWGPERIERRLLQAGVDPAVAAAAVADRDGEDELEAALGLLRRRLRAVPESDKEREKALGMLVRKGYALELAYDAVRAFERGAAA